MSKIRFIDENGTFELKNPQHTSGLYMPLASRGGLKSAVAPDFGGDAKTDQNHFRVHHPDDFHSRNNDDRAAV